MSKMSRARQRVIDRRPAFSASASRDREVHDGPRPRVVIVGGGFAGIQAALGLARLQVDVTLVDRRNFHLFQPLAYQVATGALSPAEIAYPLRRIFRRHGNVRVVLAEATDFDLDTRRVRLRSVADDSASDLLEFDFLIVASGSQYDYFGHNAWEQWAPNLKTLDGALTIRSRILSALERAELEPDPERRAAWLTFVIVGAGPTGVEMAGQIAELTRDLRSDFRSLDSTQARILLVEAGDRVLSAFAPSLSRSSARSLQRLGVTLRLRHAVVAVDEGSVTLELDDNRTERIRTHTVIWAAGVRACDLAGALAHRASLRLDRAGRVEVQADLSLPDHPEVFALGDMVAIRQSEGQLVTLPGLAPVAMQQGRHAARAVNDRLHERPSQPFRYHDKGNLATIGRARAVAEVRGLRLSGLPAWITWLTVHLWYLIGFQNRLIVVIRWAFSFITHGRGARLITSEGPMPAAASATEDSDAQLSFAPAGRERSGSQRPAIP